MNPRPKTPFHAAFYLLVAVLAAFCSQGCDDATIASENISEAARNFEIDRRIIFLNGITNDYLLSIEGRCSLVDETGVGGAQLEVTCKLGDRDYRKHFLGLSDNVSYFAEQLSPGDVSAYHYRLVFKPQTVIPDFDFRAEPGEIIENTSERMQRR